MPITQFTRHFGLYRQNQVGYQSDQFLPMGVVPVRKIKG